MIDLNDLRMLKGLCDRFEYPGMRITLEPGRQWTPHAVVFQRVLEDATEQRESIVQTLRQTAPARLPEDEFFRWMRWCVQEMQRHETDEWITVDGVRRFDPHRVDHEAPLDQTAAVAERPDGLARQDEGRR